MSKASLYLRMSLKYDHSILIKSISSFLFGSSDSKNFYPNGYQGKHTKSDNLKEFESKYKYNISTVSERKHQGKINNQPLIMH